MIDETAVSLSELSLWTPAGRCQSVNMLRLDLLHPVISGNKWFKLKYHLEAAQAEGKETLLTFGGGYSNHLVATAFAANEQGLRSIGLVRGNYSGSHLTPTLRACVDYGMRLEFLPKAEYAAAVQKGVGKNDPSVHFIREGGADDKGVKGASEIALFVPAETTDVCVAVGTGTTLRGLLAALPERVRVHGFYVAKDIQRLDAVKREIGYLSEERLVIHLAADPRFGRWRPEAETFIRRFHAATGVPLDVVYTSKMMMRVEELAGSGVFGPHSRVVCIHTGGLQGNPEGLRGLMAGLEDTLDRVRIPQLEPN